MAAAAVTASIAARAHQETVSENETENETEEEVRDFARRFARLVITRAFREGGCAATGDRTLRAGSDSYVPADATTTGRSALSLSIAEAEVSLRGSQRLGSQLESDAEELHSQVLPNMRENARQLQALYVAIDRVAEEVMPEIEKTVKRMEKAAYDLEGMRERQVDTRGNQGSYGLGLALGAGLWGPEIGESDLSLPDVFDTDTIFHAEEGGLAPL